MNPVDGQTPRGTAGKGYIKIARSLFDNPLWQERRNFSRAEAWIDLIQMAAYRDHDVILKGETYRLKRGDVLHSQRDLAKRWAWSERKVRRWLQSAAGVGTIVVQSVPHKCTQLTLCNYDYYQNSGRTDARSERRTVTAQSTDVLIKGNKGKEMVGNGRVKSNGELTVTEKILVSEYGKER